MTSNSNSTQIATSAQNRVELRQNPRGVQGFSAEFLDHKGDRIGKVETSIKEIDNHYLLEIGATGSSLSRVYSNIFGVAHPDDKDVDKRLYERTKKTAEELWRNRNASFEDFTIYAEKRLPSGGR